jgi:hypothetical protein
MLTFFITIIAELEKLGYNLLKVSSHDIKRLFLISNKVHHEENIMEIARA